MDGGRVEWGGGEQNKGNNGMSGSGKMVCLAAAVAAKF